jgi:hypothetical protein
MDSFLPRCSCQRPSISSSLYINLKDMKMISSQIISRFRKIFLIRFRRFAVYRNNGRGDNTPIYRWLWKLYRLNYHSIWMKRDCRIGRICRKGSCCHQLPAFHLESVRNFRCFIVQAIKIHQEMTPIRQTLIIFPEFSKAMNWLPPGQQSKPSILLWVAFINTSAVAFDFRCRHRGQPFFGL